MGLRRVLKVLPSWTCLPFQLAFRAMSGLNWGTRSGTRPADVNADFAAASVAALARVHADALSARSWDPSGRAAAEDVAAKARRERKCMLTVGDEPQLRYA